MAKFRKIKRYAKRVFARSRSRGNNGTNVLNVALGSALYGAVRPYAANLIPDVMGQYTDNVVLAGVGYYLAKKTGGMTKTAGISILAGEAFIVGAKLMNNTASTTNSGYVYG